jgi:hypothetical protein
MGLGMGAIHRVRQGLFGPPSVQGGLDFAGLQALVAQARGGLGMNFSRLITTCMVQSHQGDLSFSTTWPERCTAPASA